MFHQTHRLCPACETRVPASAAQCPECESKLTPVRRLDTVRVTLALICLVLLASGAVWTFTADDPPARRARHRLLALRDWSAPDSAGLALDSTIEARLGTGDSAAAMDSTPLLTGGRTGHCEPYDPRRNPLPRGSRRGPVTISNQSGTEVLMTIYHPDGQGWSTFERRVPPRRTIFLVTSDGVPMVARDDWGVQVEDFCVELFERVAGWTGEGFTLTWAGSAADKD